MTIIKGVKSIMSIEARRLLTNRVLRLSQSFIKVRWTI